MLLLTGRIQKFQKGGGGGGSQILEGGGGRNSTFQCSFQSFSYKSLTNIPPKGGPAARPAPPLNPRLTEVDNICCLILKIRSRYMYNDKAVFCKFSVFITKCEKHRDKDQRIAEVA